MTLWLCFLEAFSVALDRGKGLAFLQISCKPAWRPGICVQHLFSDPFGLRWVMGRSPFLRIPSFPHSPCPHLLVGIRDSGSLLSSVCPSVVEAASPWLGYGALPRPSAAVKAGEGEDIGPRPAISRHPGPWETEGRGEPNRRQRGGRGDGPKGQVRGRTPFLPLWESSSLAASLGKGLTLRGPCWGRGLQWPTGAPSPL